VGLHVDDPTLEARENYTTTWDVTEATGGSGYNRLPVSPPSLPYFRRRLPGQFAGFSFRNFQCPPPR
jgi:hypothetical protein